MNTNEIFHPIKDFNYYKEFLKNAFTILNGEVNTNILARRLALQNLDMDETEFGYNLAFFIVLDLRKIYNYTINSDTPHDETLKGMILYVLIHELSHCDQYIIPFFNSKEYIRNIEFTNNENCMRFIYRKEKFLKYSFGNFKIPSVIFEMHNRDKEFYKSSNSYFLYEQSKSPKDKFISLFEKLSKLNFHKYIRENKIKNVDLVFNYMNKYKKTFNMYFDSIYSMSKIDIDYISKLFCFTNLQIEHTPTVKCDQSNSYSNIEFFIREEPKLKSSYEILI